MVLLLWDYALRVELWQVSAKVPAVISASRYCRIDEGHSFHPERAKRQR